MTERDRDEEIEHRALTRLNAMEHERERAVEDDERALDAEAARKIRVRDVDHARRRRRLMMEWSMDQDARALDVAQGMEVEP